MAKNKGRENPPAAETSSGAARHLPLARGRQGGERWTLRQDLLRDGVLQLYIYGDVEGDYYDWWTGQTIESETSADHFREELGKYPDAREIEIFINSYGGEVFEGTAIYNQLRRHPAHKTVRIDGFACSIASVIAMAGDEVIMPRNTLMMIHNMWMGAVGNAAQLRKAADDLDVINAAGRQAYLQKAGDKLDEAELIAMMDAETWLTAEDCIRLGLADKFADEDADLSAAGAILQKVNDGLERQVERNREIAARLREVGETPAGGATSSAAAAAAELGTSHAARASGSSPRGEGMGRAAEGVGPYEAAEKEAPPLSPAPEAGKNPAPEKRPEEQKDAKGATPSVTAASGGDSSLKEGAKMPGGLMAFLAGVDF